MRVVELFILLNLLYFNLLYVSAEFIDVVVIGYLGGILS
ncbi:hypothetical protein PPBDW_p0005 (plasmid) [Photobacterium kishitanii]|nr:hypothetical protein PPBDW_p0005 [Photobacterium kishitanii]